MSCCPVHQGNPLPRQIRGLAFSLYAYAVDTEK
jgi:hypothetical protein